MRILEKYEAALKEEDFEYKKMKKDLKQSLEVGKEKLAMNKSLISLLIKMSLLILANIIFASKIHAIETDVLSMEVTVAIVFLVSVINAFSFGLFEGEIKKIKKKYEFDNNTDGNPFIYNYVKILKYSYLSMMWLYMFLQFSSVYYFGIPVLILSFAVVLVKGLNIFYLSVSQKTKNSNNTEKNWKKAHQKIEKLEEVILNDQEVLVHLLEKGENDSRFKKSNAYNELYKKIEQRFVTSKESVILLHLKNGLNEKGVRIENV